MSDNQISIRAMGAHEFSQWGALRSRLWPDCSETENQQEYAQLQAGISPIKIVLLAFSSDTAIGFAELSERSVVDGCGNAPAAYLEGWYVEPEFQGRGIGKSLVEAAVVWAKKQGYQFLGSDVEMHNTVSQIAHQKLGFVETGRAINYHMKL